VSADHNLNDPLIYVRALHFAATITAGGVVWFIAFIGEPAFRHAKQDTGAALFITVTGTIYVADEISPA
jgi:hypothetical protein